MTPLNHFYDFDPDIWVHKIVVMVEVFCVNIYVIM